MLDLAEVVTGSVEIVAYKLRSAGIRVEIDLPDDLPPVEGDRDLLGQVFSNILINGQQALITRPMPHHIRISGRIIGDHLRVRIEDDGPGVPEALRERILDPYSTTRAVEVGDGIGLGQGDLQGACSDVALPAATVLKVPEDTAPDGAPLQRAARILIVGDEPDVAASLAEMIAMQGHHTTIAVTAEGALSLARSGQFDAVFTDLRMPGMDGVDLIGAIAAAVPRLAGRMALVTGETVAGPAHVAGKASGPLPVLAKPFTPAEIAALLTTLMSANLS